MNNTINNMITTLKELVSYNTVREEAFPNAPFGKTNRECLTRTLDIGKELGFDTFDCEGYAGHIEYKGTGAELVGVLGHLDIVPAGDGWTYPPFACEVHDGYMYGRGVLDDKGPVVACLYAMKKLKDEGFVPTRSIRLIMGCNEENGSTCVERYFKTETMPDVAFSPDGDFPLIHCEKGIVWIGLSIPTNLKFFSSITGGDKTNMVPAKASAIYSGELDTEYFVSKGLIAEKCDTSCQCGKAIKVTAVGRSAHGSTPAKGDNAINKLLAVICEIENDENLNYLYNTFSKDVDGTNAKIKSTDQKSGDLSMNFGTISTDNSTLKISLDVRYPISLTLQSILDILAENAPLGHTINVLNAQAGLFVDPDSALVKTLMGIYKKHTGSNSPSIAIGGGTYARELKCGVAFGPMFEDEESTIHMPNERLRLDYFEKMFHIYYDAIKELSK